MSPLVLSFFKIVVMLVLICLMYLNAIEYKTIDSEISLLALCSKEKKNTSSLPSVSLALNVSAQCFGGGRDGSGFLLLLVLQCLSFRPQCLWFL